MRAAETIEILAAAPDRRAGSDGERRAGVALRDALQANGWVVETATFWCRPNLASAMAWHVALAALGSLLGAASPRAGAAMVLLAITAMVADQLTGVSPGRLLSRSRASQNLLARRQAPGPESRTLLITASLDVPRAGLLDSLTRPLGLASPALLAGVMAWLTVVLLLRAHDSAAAIRVLQLIPSVLLILCLAVLVDRALGPASPSSPSDAALGIAVALASALSGPSPAGLQTELLIQGAGAEQSLGLRRHLRSRGHLSRRARLRSRRRRPGETLVVVGIAAGNGDRPAWVEWDGAPIPLRVRTTLRNLARRAAANEPELGARRRRRSSASPAFSALPLRVPAICLSAVDNGTDDPQPQSPRELDATIEFGLHLAELIEQA